MQSTFFKLAWRNLWKHSGISAINILGLSLSLGICALIGLFVQHELGFDRANPEHARIYRLNTTFKYPNSPERPTAMSSAMMGPFLQREHSDVEQYLRIVVENEEFLCRAGKREAGIEKCLRADTSFFSFFPYRLLHGSRETAFARPENILLARHVSELLFGHENPVGKVIDYRYSLGNEGADTTVHYVVSAVFDHLPDDSHLHFDALMPLDDAVYSQWNANARWHGVVANTYLRLHPAAKDPARVAAAFPALLKKEMPSSEMIALSLQPLTDIHLGSLHLEYDENNFQKSDRKQVYVLGLIALFILLISGVNFANLSTVTALRRVKEVGVRKSIGASRGAVVLQFLGEALFVSVLAGGLGALWMEVLREPFAQLFGRDVELWPGLEEWAGLAGVILALGLLAGLFPARQAARFTAAQAFRRDGTAVSTRRPFVRSLVVLQFALSTILLIGSVICYRQMWFLRHKDLGFQYEQVAQMPIGPGNWARYAALKQAFQKIPGVVAVSGSEAMLGAIDRQNGVLVRNNQTRAWENYPMNIIRADYDYFDLYQMAFVAGQAPSPEGARSEREYVVNEAFVKKAGWTDDPVGHEILRAGLPETETGRVVGVLRDIHYNDLRRAIEPICIQASVSPTVLSVKLKPNALSETLPRLQAAWAALITDRPFQFEFVDEHFATLYAAESRLGRSLLAATLLAVLIACLGLLALSAFIIQQRTKEIGVRKVLGATTASVAWLLSKDFLKLAAIAVLLAAPVAWWAMSQWLQDFAYRIDLHWWMFAGAGLLALAVAFFTVNVQSMRAALANPVRALKNE